MLKKHLYNPGDMIIEYWEVKGIKVNIARYLIYDKEYGGHSEDFGYTSYKAYIMYTYDPYERSDRSGLGQVGETYEIKHWNDWDVLTPHSPYDGIEVVESGLSWEDID